VLAAAGEVLTYATAWTTPAATVITTHKIGRAGNT
jgi:hypothetical protein